MARNAGVIVENNFSNGLVTEATGLNFPENAVTSTNNCVFHSSGYVTRRAGIDLEPGFTHFVADSGDNVTTEYVWEAVGGDGNLSFLVQQIGVNLHFLNISGTGSLSSGYFWSMNMSVFGVDPSILRSEPASFTTGLGRLLVTHPGVEPFYVQYNRDDNTLLFQYITIRTRDFAGVQPRPSNQRPTSPTNVQRYNLANQGWTVDRQNEFNSKAGFFPSDYEVWWLYKRPDQYGNEIFLPTDIFSWQAALYNLDRGNSPAPMGSMILYEFQQDRSGASGVGGIPVVTSGAARPSTCAFHSGRVFYSGVRHQDFSSKIYFSQIIESPVQFGKAYQENDPTSQYSPDLLPSDGGVISIPEAGSILKLWSVNNSLIVVCTNGVWEITGSSGIGFTAIDYTVKKISSLATVSSYSFVNVIGAPVWWGQDGILAAVSQGDVAGITVVNLSEEKIKTFYKDILESSRKYAKGAFNPQKRIIQWVYRSSPSSSIEERQIYDSILNYDMNSKAFYSWTYPAGNTKIRGIVCVQGSGSTLADDPVRDNFGSIVTNNSGATVTIGSQITTVLPSTFRYTTFRTLTEQWTYSAPYENVHRDFFTGDGGGGTIFDSEFVSGYRIRGNAISKQQTNYIQIFNEGEGTVQLYGRWDYSNSGDSGRWSSPQLLSFNEESKDVDSCRVKIRGHGLALQISVKSLGENAFKIIGWTTFDTTNTRP